MSIAATGVPSCLQSAADEEHEAPAGKDVDQQNVHTQNFWLPHVNISLSKPLDAFFELK